MMKVLEFAIFSDVPFDILWKVVSSMIVSASFIKIKSFFRLSKMLLKMMARIFCDLNSEGILSEVIIMYICVMQAAVLEIHKSELLHKGIVSDMGGAASSHCRLL